ncbi:hypothetical protein F2Q68_00033694 [Brassica cretica]|uniref:BHLH domain-containing protein n=1 Tax=Brassica cretica TaxID=69181 RepID=A0A8S9H5P0_BRACR|nr:hypothetical protein F2Q68_00033694 [Brassica cretica]
MFHSELETAVLGRSRMQQAKCSTKKKNKSLEENEKLSYVHVRARRGEATDSHSLAERARREKINTRMKLLHELVPGCDKQWLSRAANVSASDFKGDGADDAEEENNDFFYDSETDHVHYVIKILFFLLYFQASVSISDRKCLRDFYDSE